MKPKDRIDDSNLWFKEILKDQENLLTIIWNNGIENDGKRTVKSFAIDIVYACQELEKKFHPLKQKMEILNDNIDQIKKTVDFMFTNDDKYEHQGQKMSFSPDLVQVAYMRNERKSYTLMNF